MMNNKLYKKGDYILSAFIVSYFVIHALNLYVKLVLGNFQLWEYLSKIPLAILLICSLPVMLRRNFKLFVSSELIVLLLFTYTFLFGFANFVDYRSIFINALVVFIPLGLSAISIANKSSLLNLFYYAAWPLHVLLIYAMIKNGNGGWDYSISLGYALVFQTLIVWEHFFFRRNIIDLLIVIIDVVLIMIFASRGPVLCLGALLIIELLFSKTTKPLNKIIYMVLLIFATMILFFNFDAIINALSDISSRFAHYSRTITKIKSDDIFSDSGRQTITNLYIGLIRENWLLGCGLGGGWMSVGDYPHSIIIEFVLSFGVFVGPLLLILLLIMIIKSYMLKDDLSRQRLFLIFSAYCCCLLVSNSFILCPHFYVLVFLGFDSKKEKYIRYSPVASIKQKCPYEFDESFRKTV